MITITKEFTWAMAHRLEGHEGQCNHVHGHNYKALITIMRLDGKVKPDLNSSDKGMVWDFKTLKDAVKLVFLDNVDHSFMYNEYDVESKELALYMKKSFNQKLCPIPFRITAENMVEWIAEQLQEFFIAMNYKIQVVKVQLYETETSYATWILPEYKILELIRNEEENG